jgi:hypothetical protein
MKTIHKYSIGVTGALDHGERLVVYMQKDAAIMDIQSQHDRITMWAKVDTDTPIVQRQFIVYYTGHEISETDHELHQYIGTVQIHGGATIYHVFELLQRRPLVIDPLTQMFDHFKPAT